MNDHVPAKELVENFPDNPEVAAAHLYDRFFQRLWTLAEKQIGPNVRSRISADDVVQSAIRTFFRRAKQGEYQVDHTGALCALLDQIVINKVRRCGAKRHEGPLDFSQFVADREPSAEDVAQLIDELDLVLKDLKPRYGDVLKLALEGYPVSEIAETVGVSYATARRDLNRIGDRLTRRAKAFSDES